MRGEYYPRVKKFSCLVKNQFSQQQTPLLTRAGGGDFPRALWGPKYYKNTNYLVLFFDPTYEI